GDSMKRIILFASLLMILIGGSAVAAPLKVVTTIADLASLTREIGGDRVDAQSIARGYQDPHFVEPKPSFLLQLRNTELLDVVGYVEPKPGVPPSPSHTFELINLMKAQKVKAILMEPYFDVKTPQSIAERTGANLVILYPSVGGAKSGTEDYFKLFDYNIAN